jgi:polysaccharide biosynthesis protein PslH
MKILWILGESPIPPDSGGKHRSLGLLKQLAPRHEVTAAVLDPGAAAGSHLGELEKLCKKIIRLPWRGRIIGARFVAGAAGKLFSPLPYSVEKYCGEESEQPLRELARQHWDIIQCENIGFRRYLAFPTSAPRLLNTQNVEARIWQQRAGLAANPILKTYLSSQARKMADYEKGLLPRYDGLIAVSETDAAAFKAAYQAKQIGVVPNGVDTVYFSPRRETPEENLVVFSGAMDYAPNSDGAKYFLQEIWPKVISSHPQARFCIVGRRPEPALLALAKKYPRVEVTGTVEDVRPYLARAAVVVVPLRMGGGSRLKILEALAMGKAIVSTSLGAEGLALAAGQQLLLAEGAEAFAEAISPLLENPAKTEAFGRSGRALVEQTYAWPVCARKLEAVWAEFAPR